MRINLVLIETLKTRYIHCKFVICCDHIGNTFFDALNKGVNHFLHIDDFVNYQGYISNTSKKKFYCSPLLLNTPKKKRKEADIEQRRYPGLTDKEATVMKLIAQNKPTKEIAQITNNSLRTIQNHRFNIRKKLELVGYHALIQYAIKHYS
ncbi:helix-turn-helix transcriptional regulator [Aquimarina celericrescens]|uniref:Helix-turn-helix transcriptional regulator n=1 Tax=Aquimarina celericrescens TaxID=1964542 RepID=A0ABW5AZL6_9FLAO|nr:response regulator transcription factor [Aquimarina celericrescens]